MKKYLIKKTVTRAEMIQLGFTKLKDSKHISKWVRPYTQYSDECGLCTTCIGIVIQTDGVICQTKNEFTNMRLVMAAKTKPITFWSKHMIKDMIKKHMIVKEV